MSAQGDPADRRPDGLVHGRRRVRPRDERRDGIVRGTGTIFIGGPPLVKAATGQDVHAEELGGADCTRDVRCRRPLCTATSTRWRSRGASSRTRTRDGPSRPGRARRPSRRGRPRRSLRPDPGRPPTLMDAREVVARVVDGRGSTSSRRCTARRSCAAGRTSRATPVGILEHGVLFRRGAHRRARTSSSWHHASRPLVFLQTSRVHGRQRVRGGGIARDGAKLVMAVACADVPKFTVVTADRSAPATTGCAGARIPAPAVMWPNARISVMAASRRRRCCRWSRRRPGRDPREVRSRGQPVLLDGALWDDGIIDPLGHTPCPRARALRGAQRADPGEQVRRLPV